MHAQTGSTLCASKVVEGEKGLLRLLTCGSVDDGKSTLIGRLLYETGSILDDQLSALERDSRKYGTTGNDLDFALLVDGLEAEREQGITIDVAYRYFASPHRSYVVADTPGHEQYTRNMATGASNCDLAALLVDARKGLSTQTFRHAIIASLMRVPHVLLCVNKMDLVGFDQSTFRGIVSEFSGFAGELSFRSVAAIPVSARYGDNISSLSERMPWYSGSHLLAQLENVAPSDHRAALPFRMPVQWVNRPNSGFRGYSGTVASGRIRAGDEILVASSGRATRVDRIICGDADTVDAVAGDAVTLVLTNELDIARGDLLADPKDRPQIADQFAAHLIWMGNEKLLPGRSYLLKIGSRTLEASVTELKHRLDINSLAKHAAKALAYNEIGFCNLATSGPIAFDPYAENAGTGAFILIDRFSNRTVAAGLLSFGLHRATNVHRQDLAVTKSARAQLKQQRPAILWFTGLSGAGKSTIANLVESRLHASGVHTIMLDGDNVRQGLNKDLGFTDVDRVENIRRIGEVAKLMTEAGLVVLCAFISPFRAERRMVRELAMPGEFIEIFVDTPLQECIARDPKGLYKRALAGKITNFTGVDHPYEAPDEPDIRLSAGREDAETLAQRVLDELSERQICRVI